MKITNLSKIALALALSSAVVFESCKKYDDDIARLEESIKTNSDDIAGLKTQLQSLANNNVVQSVETITTAPGGFKITFKRPDGSTFSHDILNGAAGAQGPAGPAGPAGPKGDTGNTGATGAAGTSWRIGTNGNWESSNNGTTWTDTGIKAQGPKGDTGAPGETGAQGPQGPQGEAGQDGADGATPDIQQGTDGKWYWFIEGQNTGKLAVPGEVAVTEVGSPAYAYWVTFTDAAGVATNVYLAKEAIAVRTLHFVPEFSNFASPVAFFPRIASGTGNTPTTHMQGYATLKYNLNPYGVGINNYDVSNGLLQKYSQQVSFRSSGSGESVASSDFKLVPNSEMELNENVVKNFGDVTVRFKPSNANTAFKRNAAGAGQDLFIALQVNNNKVEGDQKWAASEFVIAKEELILPAEVSIELVTEVQRDGAGKRTAPYAYLPGYSGAGFNFNYSAFTGTAFTAGGDTKANTLLPSSVLPTTSVTSAVANHVGHFNLHVYANHERQIPNVQVPLGTAYKGSVLLEKDKLRGFFGRNQVSGPAANRVVNMDDNGLEGYDLRFEYAYPAGSEPGDSHRNWLNLDKATGEVSVNESTPGAYNTAAIGHYAVVRVRLFANATIEDNGTNHIAERYVKINFTQDVAQPVNITGQTKDFYLGGTGGSTGIWSGDSTLTWVHPSTILDQAYNSTNKTDADFHAAYYWQFDAAYTNSYNPNNVATNRFASTDGDYGRDYFKFTNMDAPSQGTPRLLAIDETKINPGTYVLVGRYIPNSSNTSDPVVNIVVTIKVHQNGTMTYAPIAAYWENNAARVYGKLVSGNWYMGGDMNEYITISNTLNGPLNTSADVPTVTYQFTIVNGTYQNKTTAPLTSGTNANGATTVARFGANPSTVTATGLQTSLGNERFHLKEPGAPIHSTPTDGTTADAFTYVHGWDYTLPANRTITIKVDYFLNGNAKAYKTEYIPVRFKNPVQAIDLLNNGTATLVDKQGGNNTQSYDVRNLLRLSDKDGVAIWNNVGTNAYNTTLLSRYGISGFTGNVAWPQVAASSVTFDRAYYTATNEPLATLPAFTSTSVSFPNTILDRGTYINWHNTGANSITESITLVYKVTITNRYNDGAAAHLDTNKDTVKEVKVVINPNPASL